MAQPSSDNSEEDLGTNETGTSKVEPSETEPSETETSETEPSEPESYDAEPKKVKQKTAKGRRHRHRLRHRRHRRRCLDNFASFATYFPRVLRQVHTGLSLSHEAVNVMDSFVKDMFEWIAEEAGHLARSNKHCTITSGEIQTAVHLLLPGEICKYAVSEATKSVIRYNTRR
ncbi:late histone H2B.L4-like [Cervus elaphus]|uniref:late histone H2B.L4-like n=1 Tax=Cervus elaphus TaxID=9860 RepID=UPI001CC304CC|nr:late histone H2B.L4-like [Cervus elaphus]